jgi:hypothetical protein
MFFSRQHDREVFELLLMSQAHPQAMSHHQCERDNRARQNAGRNLHFDKPSFTIHDQSMI